MENVLILTFAALAIIFLVLWLISYSRDESYGQLTKEVRGINDTLNRLVYKMPSPQVASEKQEAAVAVPKAGTLIPVTIESLREALRCNGYSPDGPTSDDPDRVWFKIDDTNYCVDASKLPYISLELGYNLESDEEDLELMKQAALDISMGMYMVKICVTPKYYVCRIDILADSYRYLRDTLSQQVDILTRGIHHFMDRCKELREEKQRSSQEAIKAALITAQNDLTGKKIPS